MNLDTLRSKTKEGENVNKGCNLIAIISYGFTLSESTYDDCTIFPKVSLNHENLNNQDGDETVLLSSSSLTSGNSDSGRALSSPDPTLLSPINASSFCYPMNQNWAILGYLPNTFIGKPYAQKSGKHDVYQNKVCAPKMPSSSDHYSHMNRSLSEPSILMHEVQNNQNFPPPRMFTFTNHCVLNKSDLVQPQTCE
ncbi:hypothetical protein NADFUDRAFT_83635 [Nadsonia fulvescens var. elongata DSM 6958]|uniref:Uncharacterized protein n=1 Tax=Nadsonia fulvescens var. elongata DSM 6958 TaxID=857566 RepID=A0A1E3PHA3_9ASCO|nr:hypothetical protein NADFUDRAFT_83635 [Nadsonia fulvescens var. elongata DSM 6958]